MPPFSPRVHAFLTGVGTLPAPAQAHIFHRSDHQTVSLTASEFVTLLRDIELEEVLCQERRG